MRSAGRAPFEILKADLESSRQADSKELDRGGIRQRLEESIIPMVYSHTAIADPVQWWEVCKEVWWEDYGDDMPQLMDASIRVLTVPPTASGGERNWSAFAHIWGKKRGRLLLNRVYKLVYIYFNQRALKRANH